MKLGYRIVTPYKFFKPEAPVHVLQPDFDWMEAIRMVTTTAKWSNHCDVKVLTDLTTEVPGEAIRLDTKHARLTLWILEVRLKYLESDYFDRDTVTVDCDELIYGDLSPWFDRKSMLSALVRADDKHQAPEAWPLLNGVQWWTHRKKSQLVEFYSEALRRAEQMPEEKIVWGSESDAVRSLIVPIRYGRHKRNGMFVNMVKFDDVMETFSGGHMELAAAGKCPWPTRPIVDFRWTRKKWQKPCFEQTWLKSVKEMMSAVS